MSEHTDRCPECRAEADAYDRLVRETEAVKAEIRRAADSVDWESLPGLIADRALAGRGRTDGRERAAWPVSWPAFLRMKPALAGLAAGLVVGAAAMYLALRAPADRAGRAEGYSASGEFLDRAELEMARRVTVDYLEKSQYMLLDVLEPGGAGPSVPPELRTERARELLQKKRYINAQLERFQMAKAKALCDQIELLFRELAQLGGGLPEAELARLRGLAEERQLLLKINLVKKELTSGV
ncbi:MAG: hypothetical protein KA243_08550 [Candidatus Aminicenantes bacterium]|nr:hypothetical protein [Candidatus Aminicenantes bacterium]NLH77112.1 hypothetical protein [Acidobacteriota bacterium]